MKNSTTDHRTRVTKLLIRRAFTRLLETKPLASISVTELCQQAGIHRGTFYGHYTDLYDLLHQMEAEMLEDFSRSLDPLLPPGKTDSDPVEISTAVFQCLKDNADICTVTLGPYGDKEFAKKLILMGRDRCVGAYQQYFQNATPQQIDYYYTFVSGGCISLLQKWLGDGMLLPAGEVARMAEDIMRYGIGFLGAREGGVSTQIPASKYPPA